MEQDLIEARTALIQEVTECIEGGDTALIQAGEEYAIVVRERKVFFVTNHAFQKEAGVRGKILQIDGNFVQWSYDGSKVVFSFNIIQQITLLTCGENVNQIAQSVVSITETMQDVEVRGIQQGAIEAVLNISGNMSLTIMLLDQYLKKQFACIASS